MFCCRQTAICAAENWHNRDHLGHFFFPSLLAHKRNLRLKPVASSSELVVRRLLLPLPALLQPLVALPFHFTVYTQRFTCTRELFCLYWTLMRWEPHRWRNRSLIIACLDSVLWLYVADPNLCPDGEFGAAAVWARVNVNDTRNRIFLISGKD